MNYRVDCSRERAFELIYAKEYEKLQECDQLRIQKKSGAVFDGFVEAPITFAPTYKFDPGTNIYDTRYGVRLH